MHRSSTLEDGRVREREREGGGGGGSEGEGEDGAREDAAAISIGFQREGSGKE